MSLLKRLMLAFIVFLGVSAAFCAAWLSFPELKTVVGSAAEFAATLTIPQGAQMLFTAMASISSQTGSSQKTGGSSAGETVAAGSSSTSSSQKGSSSSLAASAVTSADSASKNGLFPVKTVQFLTSEGVSDETYGGICVYNQTTSHKPDIKNQLAIRPDIHLDKTSGPQVLIIHTHTTESYASSYTGFYNPNSPTRSTDKTKGVVRVGDEIAMALEANGISVIHDTNYHDYPDFNDAYAKTLTDIQSDLKEYPSIQVVLDIHRDAIQYSDGTRAKPTAVINGKKAAQVMIVAPCDESTSLPIPGWLYNYRFGLRLQQKMQQLYPGLARPLNLCPRRYNMQVSHGSLLVEFGTDVNTLDEATYAGQLFGNALSQVLLSLKG
ncbi:MAG: stage II sporulation protein P [Clostridia bacterium]|nr:stage II sporulation protein P [Clostridia bacterium]